jgi:hypothetical protein
VQGVPHEIDLISWYQGRLFSDVEKELEACGSSPQLREETRVSKLGTGNFTTRRPPDSGWS